jgi:hypothetical protein
VAAVATRRHDAEELSAASIMAEMQWVKEKAIEIYEANRGVDDPTALKALQRISCVNSRQAENR